MRVHPQIPIGEIAASMPHVTKLLDILGIDYVLHGASTFREACSNAGVDPAMVKQAIESLPRADGEQPAWADVSMQDMLEELRDHRHPRLRAMLVGTAALLSAFPHGWPGIAPLRAAFTDLCNELQPHMTREEHMLFPLVQHLEDCWTKSERPAMGFVGGVARPLSALAHEHESVVRKLEVVQRTAADVEADVVSHAVLDAVANLVQELREHIHLENNVLYPRAAALEAAVMQGPVS